MSDLFPEPGDDDDLVGMDDDDDFAADDEDDLELDDADADADFGE